MCWLNIVEKEREGYSLKRNWLVWQCGAASLTVKDK
jgi:hypothetical protein